jgi:hypothetical protein
MPTLAQNITRVRTSLGNKYTREQILEVFNEVEEEVFEQPTIQNTVLSAVNGLPPFLATTARQYVYNCPANCRITAAIFVERPVSRYSTAQERNLYQDYIYSDTHYYRVKVNQTEATPSSVATITFPFDPGTTTVTYHHLYYLRHTDITDESETLVIPSRLHRLLRRAVMGVFRDENYDPAGVAGMDLVERYAKKIRQELNKGARPQQPGRTPWQPEYRDYGYREREQ